jgi:hypothetical protein
MRSRRIGLVIFLSTMVPACVAAEDGQSIPREFHGVWGSRATQCSVKDWRNLDTLHRISGNKVEWWEAACEVTQAIRPKEEKNTVEVQLTCSGEGEEWTSGELWKLIEIERSKYFVTAIPGRGRIQIYRSCR